MTSEEDEDSNDDEILRNSQQQFDKLFEPNNVQSDITNKCEKRSADKRKNREDESNEEDDFITVLRRRPKRLIRSESLELQNKRVDVEKNVDMNNNHEVCITSLESMPKQMALAKLLKSENIKNIIRIKYKSFNKVLVRFQEKDDAIKLLDCIKLKELGFRSQFINELSISYGVIKGIDLDLSEEEIMNILESNVEIVSAKRLKRVNLEGKWVASESVRIGFKDKKIPQYVYAYDCRLKVDSYVFPVTQCSGCWQFGHVVKYCPTKKKLCPKCGGNHENCDRNHVICLNCKGNHLVIDKKCPLFLKEKQIRTIMSMEQVPYRRALQIVIETQQKDFLTDTQKNSSINDTTQTTIQSTSVAAGRETYSSVTSRNKANLQQNSEQNEILLSAEQSTQEEEMEIAQDNTTRRSLRKKVGSKNQRSAESQSYTEPTITKQGGVWSLRNLSISVPRAVLSGEGQSAVLRCSYDLEDAALYSIRWYRAETEFYRYVPREMPPTMVFPLPGASVDLTQSDHQQVRIVNLNRRLSGDYQCEVSADAPLFHTDIRSAPLTVVDPPFRAPHLSISRDSYARGDILRANCSVDEAYPAPNITWILDDHKIAETVSWRTSDLDFKERGAFSRLEITILEAEHYKMGLTYTSASLSRAYQDNYYGYEKQPEKEDKEFLRYTLVPPPTGQFSLSCVATIFDIYARKSEPIPVREDAPHPASVTGEDSSGYLVSHSVALVSLCACAVLLHAL